MNDFCGKKLMIVLSGVVSIIGLIFSAVSMGTNHWIVSTGCNKMDYTSGTCNKTGIGKLKSNYGLFKGLKSTDLTLGRNTYSLTVFCPSNDSVCLLSCGLTAEEQKKEFEYLRYGASPFDCTISTKSATKEERDRSNVSYDVPESDDKFLDYSSWVATIVFLALTLTFQAIAVGLCAFNTYTVPIEIWLGPMGIYIANGATFVTSLITLSVWGDLYSRHLSKHLPVQEIIIEEWFTDNNTLGYSYWLVLGSLIVAIVACVFVRFRNVMKRYYANKEGAISNDSPGGAIYLY